LSLCIEFRMPRPKGHYGSGRNADALKPSVPREHVCTPDLDNLIKAVMDAMTVSGWWVDDSQVVEFGRMSKRWASKGDAGATITIISQ
jgi:Holliday junction resolvase RusA-like endonuclease